MIVVVMCVMATALLLYSFYVLRFSSRWNAHTIQPSKTPRAVSVIVPFRNEASNLSETCKSFRTQQRFAVNCEIIFVNDSSTDQSSQLLAAAIAEFTWPAVVLENKGLGKKAAIRTGVEAAKHDWIVTTDMGTHRSHQWLFCWQNLTNPIHQLIVGPVRSAGPKWSFFNLEYALLNGVAIGSAAAGTPISCSGANLGFSKALYLKATLEDLRSDIGSGDDIFLLQFAKSKAAPIGALSIPDAVVDFIPEHGWWKTIRQRMRWAGKIRVYRDLDTLLFTSSGAVFYVTAVVGIALTSSPPFLAVIIGMLIGKTIVDLPLAAKSTSLLRQKHLLLILLPVEFIYLIYLPLMAMGSQIFKSKWKGRNG